MSLIICLPDDDSTQTPNGHRSGPRTLAAGYVHVRLSIRVSLKRQPRDIVCVYTRTFHPAFKLAFCIGNCATQCHAILIHKHVLYVHLHGRRRFHMLGRNKVTLGTYPGQLGR